MAAIFLTLTSYVAISRSWPSSGVTNIVTHAEKHMPGNCRCSERPPGVYFLNNQASLTIIHIWR
jgi:hypothetical protein